MRIDSPIRLGKGGNVREHHFARARRVKKEREAVGLLLRQMERPATPCVFTITRIAPSAGLDEHDNLPYSAKGAVDAIAEWMGIDDKRSDLVRYEFKNERGAWGLRIEA